MNRILIDLYSHQAWADALHWKALEAFPASLNDARLYERLYHIHIVQSGYLSIISNRKFEFKKLEDFQCAEDLKKFAINFHIEIADVINSIPDERLKEPVTIPWFNNPPLNINLEQALMQVIMHSQYHRGQNATRLRELGGEPPNTDFVIWYWKGCPSAEW